jgi:hypothetical protein
MLLNILSRYQNISRQISTSIVAEEKRTRYFTNEMKKWALYQQKVKDQNLQQNEFVITEKQQTLYNKTLEKSILGRQLEKFWDLY